MKTFSASDTLCLLCFADCEVTTYRRDSSYNTSDDGDVKMSTAAEAEIFELVDVRCKHHSIAYHGTQFMLAASVTISHF